MKKVRNENQVAFSLWTKTNRLLNESCNSTRTFICNYVTLSTNNGSLSKFGRW